MKIPPVLPDFSSTELNSTEVGQIDDLMFLRVVGK
jgi:hypothetical protein